MYRDQYEAELIVIAREAAPKGYATAKARVMGLLPQNLRYAHISRARAIALVNYGVRTREES